MVETGLTHHETKLFAGRLPYKFVLREHAKEVDVTDRVLEDLACVAAPTPRPNRL